MFEGAYIFKKDADKKRIHEGDILKTNGIDGELFWLVYYDNEEDPQFDLECLNGNFSSCHNRVWDEGIIVADVYAQPEMLGLRRLKETTNE
jgi:hypothetical protein